jgi:hypothetical protein
MFRSSVGFHTFLQLIETVLTALLLGFLKVDGGSFRNWGQLEAGQSRGERSATGGSASIWDQTHRVQTAQPVGLFWPGSA